LGAILIGVAVWLVCDQLGMPEWKAAVTAGIAAIGAMLVAGADWW
jgi:hypothetical protein